MRESLRCLINTVIVHTYNLPHGNVERSRISNTNYYCYSASNKDIVHTYGGNLSVREVWYFTDNKAAVNALKKVVEGYSKVKELKKKAA